MLKSIFHNFQGKLSASPIFSSKLLRENIFLSLLFMSFFVVGAELATDMARENGEISFFYEVLEDSHTTDNLSYLDYLKADLPIVGIMHIYDHFHQDIQFSTLHAGRAPPSFNS